MTCLLLPCLLPNQITFCDINGAKWLNGLIGIPEILEDFT